MKNRAGEYRTNLSGELQYKSFLPKPLPPDPPVEIDEETAGPLSKANRSIGILEGLSRQIPNIELFVSMYVRKEALSKETGFLLMKSICKFSEKTHNQQEKVQENTFFD